MTASIVLVALALRTTMATLSIDHIPMSSLGAIATFAAIIGIAQIASALMLRHKAVLIPVSYTGS